MSPRENGPDPRQPAHPTPEPAEAATSAEPAEPVTPAEPDEPTASPERREWAGLAEPIESAASVHPTELTPPGMSGERSERPDAPEVTDPHVAGPAEAPAGTVPSQPSMLGTSETMRPAEGVYAPEGDLPE